MVILPHIDELEEESQGLYTEVDVAALGSKAEVSWPALFLPAEQILEVA